ncbi:hypothetical protein PLICRDRAFT_514727 [Plicaturopsis crispa FD-325 SS-3]|nr:hypothetical protein PLICRDRAFT_514727 [Plicaturopsis crispa FD-325 SS-3]
MYKPPGTPTRDRCEEKRRFGTRKHSQGPYPGYIGRAVRLHAVDNVTAPAHAVTANTHPVNAIAPYNVAAIVGHRTRSHTERSAQRHGNCWAHMCELGKGRAPRLASVSTHRLPSGNTHAHSVDATSHPSVDYAYTPCVDDMHLPTVHGIAGVPEARLWSPAKVLSLGRVRCASPRVQIVHTIRRRHSTYDADRITTSLPSLHLSPASVVRACPTVVMWLQVPRLLRLHGSAVSVRCAEVACRCLMVAARCNTVAGRCFMVVARSVQNEPTLV